MSSMTWAENEIKIACKRENPEWDGKSFDYGCSCYQSALKAYKSLCDDGHSGFSFNATAAILTRLMHGLPLTPITDTEDNWSPSNFSEDSDERKSYQCRRKFSLFKNVDKNGNVSYHDVDRAYCEEINNPEDRFTSSACCIVDELFPITMPYYPKSEGRYKVVVDTFAADGFEGGDTDFNTRAILYVITPDNKKVKVNRYYKTEGCKFVEISKDEYKNRLKHRKQE